MEIINGIAEGGVMLQKTAMPEKVEENLDCEGFLQDRKFWTETVAERLAEASEMGNLVLSESHWKVIRFVREYYEIYSIGPPIVKVAKHCGLSLKDFCKLFPCGLVKGAYKIAGLPRPPGCVG